MARENNAVKLRRALLAKLARLMREGRLAEGVDGIPFEITREGWEVTGCCVHHDRALIRLRLLAMETARHSSSPWSAGLLVIGLSRSGR